MRKKTAMGIVALAITASLVAGCGGSDTSTSTETASGSSGSMSESTGTGNQDVSTESAGSASESVTSSSSSAGDGWVIDMDNMMEGSPFEGLKANGDYKYQMIVKSYSASIFQIMEQGAMAAAEDLGVQVDCNGPNTESDIADQVNMFNSAIMNEPDGVAIAASDAGAVLDSMKLAQEKGVPIVAFDSAITDAPDSLIATVATDSPAAGKLGAENVYKAVSYKVKDSDSPIRIGMVAQDTTSLSNSQRGMGFVNGIIELGTADGYKVAVTGNDYFVDGCTDAGDESSADIIVECRVPSLAQVEQCANEVSAILNKSDTVAVFGTNQTVTEGIVQANQNLNILGSDPETSILGTGFDAGPAIKSAVADGTLYGCVTQMPYAMGYYSVCTMVQNSNGDAVSDLPIPAYWYNADNMDDPMIAPNLYD